MNESGTERERERGDRDKISGWLDGPPVPHAMKLLSGIMTQIYRDRLKDGS